MARWMTWLIVHLATALLSGPCTPRAAPTTDGRAKFEPIGRIQRFDHAVVRIYSAPIPNATSASHLWIVAKKARAHTLDRWEVWQTGCPPYGHVRKNQASPEADVGAGGVEVVAETVGKEAERVIQFIESRSPTYPCRDAYCFFGPNSNTYAQWVLNQTGWRVRLPAGAIGRWAVGACTE